MQRRSIDIIQNKEFKCVMLESEVRRLNGVRNFILRNLEYYDDFKQIYEVILVLPARQHADADRTPEGFGKD